MEPSRKTHSWSFDRGLYRVAHGAGDEREARRQLLVGCSGVRPGSYRLQPYADTPEAYW